MEFYYNINLNNNFNNITDIVYKLIKNNFCIINTNKLINYIKNNIINDINNNDINDISLKIIDYENDKEINIINNSFILIINNNNKISYNISYDIIQKCNNLLISINYYNKIYNDNDNNDDDYLIKVKHDVIYKQLYKDNTYLNFNTKYYNNYNKFHNNSKKTQYYILFKIKIKIIILKIFIY